MSENRGLTMREILFRGKRTDNGEWETGSLVIIRDGCSDKEVFIADKMTGYHTPVIPETVGEFTGVTDKNGRKIFERDIIEITDTFNKIISGVVYWCDGAFWADCSHPDCDDGFYRLGYLDLGDCVEVIGNIYDNPELLKGGSENG